MVYAIAWQIGAIRPYIDIRAEKYPLNWAVSMTPFDNIDFGE
jgi:hypothetical protein